MRVSTNEVAQLCGERKKVKEAAEDRLKRIGFAIGLDEYSLAKENALSLIRNLERLNEIENRLADMLE